MLDEDQDDLASWPMAHVHDWSGTLVLLFCCFVVLLFVLCVVCFDTFDCPFSFYAATGKHDIEVHVPEGTLEFGGIQDVEMLLNKLAIIHSALSAQ